MDSEDLPSPNISSTDTNSNDSKLGQYVSKTVSSPFKPTNIAISSPKKKNDRILSNETPEFRYNTAMRMSIQNTDSFLKSMNSPIVSAKKKKSSVESILRRGRIKRKKIQKTNIRKLITRSGPKNEEIFDLVLKGMEKKMNEEKNFLIGDTLQLSSNEKKINEEKKKFDDIIKKRVQMKLDIIKNEKKNYPLEFNNLQKVRKRCNESLYRPRLTMSLTDKLRLKEFLGADLETKNKERKDDGEEEISRKFAGSQSLKFPKKNNKKKLTSFSLRKNIRKKCISGLMDNKTGKNKKKKSKKNILKEFFEKE